MAYLRSEVVKQAQAWLGVKQGTEAHKDIVDIYNSHKPLARGYKAKYTSAWCSLFVSAVSIKLGYTKIIPTEVSCHYHVNLFKKLGAWVESDSYIPREGDIILYDWQDSNPKSENKNSPDHIGVVEKVENGTITVIEGNCDSAVKRRTIKVNGKYIRGYGVPKYDEVPAPAKPTVGTLTETSDKTSDNEKTSDKSIDELAKEVLAGKHGNGQARVKSLGDKYAEVQKRVNELSKASTKEVKLGAMVDVSSDAKIGGLASNRGQKASTYLTSRDWKVKAFAVHKGEKEALLSCNTWIAVKYLKAK